MDFLDHIRVPRRLSSRVWLVSLPSALVSFERRQRVPKMPVGSLRYAGLPLMVIGTALAVRAWRPADAPISNRGPLSQIAQRPATAGGILALAGVSLFFRSPVLAAYCAGLVLATGSNLITIDDPDLPGFLGQRRNHLVDR